MTEKKDLVKSIMINLGILLILVSTTAAKELNITYFILGLIILAIQTLDMRGIDAKRLVSAEIIISGALSLAGVIQLIMSRSFGAAQIYIILLLLGGILVTVEAVRKYADL